MQHVRDQLRGRKELLARIEGTKCGYCDGALVRDSYKGNDTVVCDSCGTPTVQLW